MEIEKEWCVHNWKYFRHLIGKFPLEIYPNGPISLIFINLLFCLPHYYFVFLTIGSPISYLEISSLIYFFGGGRDLGEHLFQSGRPITQSIFVFFIFFGIGSIMYSIFVL